MINGGRSTADGVGAFTAHPVCRRRPSQVMDAVRRLCDLRFGADRDRSLHGALTRVGDSDMCATRPSPTSSPGSAGDGESSPRGVEKQGLCMRGRGGVVAVNEDPGRCPSVHLGVPGAGGPRLT